MFYSSDSEQTVFTVNFSLDFEGEIRLSEDDISYRNLDVSKIKIFNSPKNLIGMIIDHYRNISSFGKIDLIENPKKYVEKAFEDFEKIYWGALHVV